MNKRRASAIRRGIDNGRKFVKLYASGNFDDETMEGIILMSSATARQIHGNRNWKLYSRAVLRTIEKS